MRRIIDRGYRNCKRLYEQFDGNVGVTSLKRRVVGRLSDKFSSSRDALNEQSNEEENISNNGNSKIVGSHPREVVKGVLAV